MLHVDKAMREYLDAQYPGILNDCIGYTYTRTPVGEHRVTLDLIYNASKLHVNLAGSNDFKRIDLDG